MPSALPPVRISPLTLTLAGCRRFSGTLPASILKPSTRGCHAERDNHQSGWSVRTRNALLAAALQACVEALPPRPPVDASPLLLIDGEETEDHVASFPVVAMEDEVKTPIYRCYAPPRLSRPTLGERDEYD